MNFLLVESLFELHTCYGNDLLVQMNYLATVSQVLTHLYPSKVEFPTGSGNKVSLATAAAALSSRLTKIFLPQEDGVRYMPISHTLFHWARWTLNVHSH